MDLTDTYGFRGVGTSWQASFGMTLNEADLLFSVRREPVANRIIFQVAHDVFDNWFRVEELGDKPDPGFDVAVQTALSELDAKAVFTEMAAYERLFGWAIIALSFVDYAQDPSQPVLNPREIRELFPYSALQFTVQTSDEDKDPNSPRFGLPNYYTVRREIDAHQLKVHYSRVIHVSTRLLEHQYKGMSVLEPVYDDLTVLRNIRWGLGQTLFRYGSGFPDVTVEGAKKKDLDNLEDSQHFKNLQARSYFLHNEKTTLDFKGVAGRALNPEPYYLPIMENISAGCGVPLAVLRGAQAGALTGSEVNEREYFKLISDAQSHYEPAVRELIDMLIKCGQIRYKWNVNRGYRIVWQGAFEMSEQTKALIEFQKAQARNLQLGWMTIDEVRALDGLEPLPNGEGAVVVGLKPKAAPPVQTSPEESQAEEGQADSPGDSGVFWLLKKLRRHKK